MHLLLSCACRLRISVSDFDILARLGDGSFSTVVLARYKGDGQQYAVKIVNKTLVLRNKVHDGMCKDMLRYVRVYDIAFMICDALIELVWQQHALGVLSSCCQHAAAAAVASNAKLLLQLTALPSYCSGMASHLAVLPHMHCSRPPLTMHVWECVSLPKLCGCRVL